MSKAGIAPGRVRMGECRVRAWLAVALVAAVVALVAVVSDAAGVPRAGHSPLPVMTTVVTVSAQVDLRATEGPAQQGKSLVRSW